MVDKDLYDLVIAVTTKRTAAAKEAAATRKRAAVAATRKKAAAAAAREKAAATRKQPAASSSNVSAKLRGLNELIELEERIASLRRELEHGVENIEHSRGNDPVMRLAVAFASELRGLVRGPLPSVGAVRRAARLALAEQAWEERLGELIEARDVSELLGVSRQRVSRMVTEGRLIALPKGSRGHRFPVWQFADLGRGSRADLATAHDVLVSEGNISPWSAASWFITEHPELEGQDPIRFLREGGDPSRLQEVAERDAARAAQ